MYNASYAQCQHHALSDSYPMQPHAGSHEHPQQQHLQSRTGQKHALFALEAFAFEKMLTLRSVDQSRFPCSC